MEMILAIKIKLEDNNNMSKNVLVFMKEMVFHSMS